jgi:hypothetical protein
MILKRLFSLAALAAVLMLSTSSAQASYTYTTTPSPTPEFFGNSVVTLVGVSSSVPGNTPSLISLATVSAASNTVPPASDSTSYLVTLAVAITNVPPLTGGPTTVNVTGTLSFMSLNSGGEVSTFTASAPSFSVTVGTVTYTLANLTYSAPTVGAPNSGSIGALITSTAIPEPASLAMLGTGLVGVVGLGLRRSRKSIV